MTITKQMVEALKAADQFITNGIELGFIRMPDASTPDPAREVPGKIRAALAASAASPKGEGEAKEWRCLTCGCRTYAGIQERQDDGNYTDGPLVRCVNCKAVYAHPGPPRSPQGIDGGTELAECVKLLEIFEDTVWDWYVNEQSQKRAKAAKVQVDEFNAVLARAKAVLALPREPEAPAASFQAGAEAWNYDMAAAPRDGTEILAWRDDQGVFVCRHANMEEFVAKDRHGDPIEEYDDSYENWWHDRWGWLERELAPTAWMPLPAEPLPIPASSEGR